MSDVIRAAYRAEISAYHTARSLDDAKAAWRHLERAHILGQPFFGLHLHSHVSMLGYAITLRDGREIAGQLTRLALAPLGNLTGKLPIGNTGRSNVSAFQPMDIPADLKSKLEK
jgi:hypothetical protein